MDDTEVTDQAQDAPEVEVSEIEKLRSDAELMAHIRGDSFLEDGVKEDAPEPTAVKEDEPADSTSDDAAVVDEPAETAEVEAEEVAGEPAKSWFDERDEQYATGYGFTAYDLAQFGSRDEFVRTLRYIDRASAQKPAEVPPAKADEPAKTAEPGEFNADGTVNKDWCVEQGYDDFQLRALEREAARNKEINELRQRSEFVQQQYMEQQQAAYNVAFHNAVESLDRPDLYGKTVDAAGRPVRIPDEKAQRRLALNQEIEVLAESYARRQQPVPPLDVLVKKAELIAFGDEIAARSAAEAKDKAAADRRQATGKALKLSTRRRPVGSVAGTTGRSIPAVADLDSPEAVLAKPAMQRFLDERGYTGSNY
jgi:hypothetical protein